MNLDTFIEKYKGKFVEYHSYNPNALNQCTDLANQWITEGLGLPAIIGTNAQDFPNKAGDNYEVIDNTPTGVPEPGDLVIFKSTDNVGHISIFVSGNASLFTSFDQNYPTGSPCKLVSHNYRNVIKWMHPKENMTSDEIAVKKTDFENLVKKSTMLDEILAKYNVADAQALYNMVAGITARQTDLTNQLGIAQAEQKNKEELLSRCQQEVLNLQDTIESLQSRLDQSNNTVVQLGKDKGTLAIQVEQLKVQLETCKQCGITQTSTIEQLINWFKNLWNKN